MQRLAHDVFVNAYATAMRPSLTVPVAIFLFAALTCAFIARRPMGFAPVEDPTEPRGHDHGGVVQGAGQGTAPTS